MKFEVDVDETDIVRKVIVDDWESVKIDIKNLKHVAKQRDLEPFEKQDLEDWKRIKKALEALIRYYYTYEDYTKILSKVKKGKCCV